VIAARTTTCVVGAIIAIPFSVVPVAGAAWWLRLVVVVVTGAMAGALIGVMTGAPARDPIRPMRVSRIDATAAVPSTLAPGRLRERTADGCETKRPGPEFMAITVFGMIALEDGSRSRPGRMAVPADDGVGKSVLHYNHCCTPSVSLGEADA
jgi:hypothetical protein